MKIIIVGATGTMGQHLVSAFEKEHEVIKAASKRGRHPGRYCLCRIHSKYVQAGRRF